MVNKSKINRKNGSALVMVLVVLLIGSLLLLTSAYIVDNLSSTTMATKKQVKLYSAAQSGIEWGKSLLLQNADVIYSDLLTFDNNFNSIHARIEDGTIGGKIIDTTTPHSIDPNITLSIEIFDCNYDPNGYFTVGLPPVKLVTAANDPTGGASQIGFSSIIDPNRNIVLNPASDYVFHYFIIKSKASTGSRDLKIENMVVLTHEE